MHAATTEVAGVHPVVRAAQQMIASKKYTYGQSRAKNYLTDTKMDCSEFVHQAHVRAGVVNFPALNSHGYAATLKKVDEPQPGDIIYWSSGHVAIVENPGLGTFLGAQSSGLAQANFKKGYWSTKAAITFHRYGGASVAK